MKKLVLIVGLLCALFASQADARPRHHVHHRAYDRSHAYVARPSDCYGIPWCGCWLRHQFGIADRTLNLARAWMRYPRANASYANVVVWPNRHHVGKVLQIRGNEMLVVSGNFGSRSGQPVWLKFNSGYSFHKI